MFIVDYQSVVYFDHQILLHLSCVTNSETFAITKLFEICRCIFTGNILTISAIMKYVIFHCIRLVNVICCQYLQLQKSYRDIKHGLSADKICNRYFAKSFFDILGWLRNDRFCLVSANLLLYSINKFFC